jgi:hypothetical protein
MRVDDTSEKSKRESVTDPLVLKREDIALALGSNLTN